MTTVMLERPQLAFDDRYPYETASFHGCWWRYLSCKFDIPYKQNDLLIYRKKFIKGLLVLNEARIAGWEVAWAQDLTEERVQGLFDLQRDYGWDYFRITWNKNRQDKQQFQLLKQAGYPMLQLDFMPQYMVDLRQGMDGYLASLGRDRRQDLKRRMRRAQALDPQLVQVFEESDIEPFFEELFSHHIAYWTQKIGNSFFNEQKERDFTVAWAKELHRSGHLQLTRFVLNGKTVNLRMGMVFGKTAYGGLTVNTGDYLEYSPGVLSLHARLELLAAQGIESCNLGTGQNTYKAEHTNHVDPAWEMVVLNPRSFKAKVYRQWLLKKHPNLQVIS